MIARLKFLVGDLRRSTDLNPNVVLRLLLLFYLTRFDSYLEEGGSAFLSGIDLWRSVIFFIKV